MQIRVPAKILITRNVALTVVACAALTAEAQQMATTVNLSVTQRGSAHFTFPITLPGATGQLQPQLALVYDSEIRDGWFGTGFALTGLPRVTRCPRTLAQDGVQAGIGYTSDDAFCLDGERLVPISGVNGMSGTEYRTEHDSFSKVTSTGVYTKALVWDSASSNWKRIFGGPISFTVLTKSGLSMEFGTSGDSQITSIATSSVTDGSTSSDPIRGWALKNVRDQAGNYWTVTYTKISQYNKNFATQIDDGVFYPTRIDFSGNATAGMQPTNWITFNWEGRSDQKIAYEGGYPVPHADMRLSRLDARVPTGGGRSKIVKSHWFNIDYTRDSARLPTQLSSIAECNDMGSICLSPVNLVWEQPSSPMLFWTGSANFPGLRNDYQSFFADLSGTGKKSWIRISQSADEVWIGTANADASFGTGNWTRVGQSVGALSNYTHIFADVNGDGKADWIRISRTTNEGWVALGNGNGSFQFWTSYTKALNAAGTTRHFLADVDGDGRADWIQITPTSIGTQTSVALATGGGNFDFWTTTVADPIDLAAFDLAFGDANGDGRADMYLTGRSGTYASYAGVRLSQTGGVFAPLSMSSNSAVQRFLIADANGDGIPDILLVKTDGSVWASIAKGDGTFLPPYQYASTSGVDQFADVAGGGMQDRFTYASGYGNISGGSVQVNTAAQTVAYDDIGLASQSSSWSYAYGVPEAIDGSHSYRYEFADLDGDGKDDLIWIDSTTGHAYIARSQYSPYAKLLGFSNPEGARTQIVYKPLSDPSVYTPDSGAQYPLRDAVQPDLRPRLARAVVASVVAPNGNGGTLITNYTYGGQKVDLARRRVLGFRWMQAAHVESGITTRTEFLQDWPLAGSASLTTTSGSAGVGQNGLLQKVETTYGCNDFVTTAGSCVVAPGRRYFAYATKSVASGWDLTGRALPMITTTTTFDNFGNALHLVNASSDGYTSTTDTTYNNDPTLWRIGRPASVTTVRTGP